MISSPTSPAASARVFGSAAAGGADWGHVYVIGAQGRRDRCKVGMTKRKPVDRLRQLQTGNPERLYLHAAVPAPDPKTLESLCHRLLAPSRIRDSEWFAVRPAVADKALRRLARRLARRAARPSRTVRVLAVAFNAALLLLGGAYLLSLA